MNKPNILILFTDMQRADTISALGNNIIKTPNLNKLVKEGTSFLNCYTPSPVCVSSRCSMMYGQYPSKTGCNDNGPMKKDNNDSFVYYLKEYGYNTHSIGKCHFTPNYKELRGFNTREIQEEIINNPDDDDYLKFLYSEGYNYIIDPHGVRGDMYYIPQLSQMPQSHHPTEWIGEKTLKFINKNKNKKPWFLFSSFIHPHPPFSLPSPWYKLYKSYEMPLPILPTDYKSLWTNINRIQNRYKFRDNGIDINLIRLIKSYYYGCISFVDYQIGKIINCLKHTAQLENTLIIFTSDHGELLGDYNCFGKRSMHSSSSKIPMIIRYPKEVPVNNLINTPVSLVDIASTCLDIINQNSSSYNLDGESLIKISKEEISRKYVFSQWNCNQNAQYMIASKDSIYFYSAADQKEFYFDHKIDPLETRNKAYTIGSSKSKTNKMRNKLFEFLVKNNVENAFEIKNKSFVWKNHYVNTKFNDPDEGLIIQDQPWVDFGIKGYSEDP